MEQILLKGYIAGYPVTALVDTGTMVSVIASPEVATKLEPHRYKLQGFSDRNPIYMESISFKIFFDGFSYTLTEEVLQGVSHIYVIR